MGVKLTIHPPNDTSTRVVELDEDEVTVGRSSRSDLRLPFRTVSGIHLTIHTDTTSGYQVRDEHSTNGTLLDGEPIEPGRDYRLSSGARLEIVDLRIDVELMPTLGEGIPLDETGTMVRKMVGEALLGATADSEDQQAYVEVIRGPAQGRRFELPDNLARGRIGPDPEATISLEAIDVSLELYRDGDGFGICPADEHAAEQVRVGGKPLKGERHLTTGDVLAWSAVELKFIDPLESYLAELDGLLDGGQQAADGGEPVARTAVDEEADREDGHDTSEGVAPELERPEDSEKAEASSADAPSEPPSADDNSPSSASGLGLLEIATLFICLVMLVGVGYLLAVIFEII